MITPSTVVYVTPKSPSHTITPYRSLRRVSASSVMPVTLQEAKTQARVDADHDDAYITSLIIAATEWAEDQCDTAFRPVTWEASYDSFPLWELILPRPPAAPSQVTITYRDEGGTDRQIVSGTDFQFDNATFLARCYPKYAQVWPPVRGDENSVRVRWDAGYATPAETPAVARHLILLLAAHWYENREPVVHGQGMSSLDIPYTVATLLEHSRTGVYR